MTDDAYPNETILCSVALEVATGTAHLGDRVTRGVAVHAVLRTTERDAKGRRVVVPRRRFISTLDAQVDAETLIDIVADLRRARVSMSPKPTCDADHWTMVQLRDDGDKEAVRALATVEFLRELAAAMEVTCVRLQSGAETPAQRVDLLYQGPTHAKPFTAQRFASAEVAP